MDYGDYELLELTVEDGIQARKLRHPATGRTLQIYAFPGDRLNDFDRLRADLAPLSRELTCLLDARREQDVGYLVTEGLPEGAGVLAWAEIVRHAPGDTLEERVYRAAWRVKLRRKPAAASAE